jgi:GxxExxY protein
MDEPSEFHGEHAELTQKVIGIFYKVSRDLGFGFLESVYKGAMMVALEEAGIRAASEVPIPVFYRGKQVGKFYADIVVEDLVIMELKAADEITRLFEAQLLHYLRSTPI